MATVLSRWFAPAVLAAGLGAAALIPGPARADDDLVRVIVDVADVIYHGGYPYYRHGGYVPNNRLVVARDRWGRPIYYRTVHRSGPPYGNAYGHWRNGPGSRSKCDKHGRCAAYYYDARYDRRRYYDRYDRDRYDRYDRYGGGYDRYDRRHDYWDRD